MTKYDPTEEAWREVRWPIYMLGFIFFVIFGIGIYLIGLDYSDRYTCYKNGYDFIDRRNEMEPGYLPMEPGYLLCCKDVYVDHINVPKCEIVKV